MTIEFIMKGDETERENSVKELPPRGSHCITFHFYSFYKIMRMKLKISLDMSEINERIEITR